MPEFTRSEAKSLSTCVERFAASFQRDVAEVIARQFRGIQPADVAEVQARANAAKNYAKATEKGRIATFEGPLFREGDLALS